MWGSRLQRLQNLTSVNSIGYVPFYSSNLRLSLEPYFVLKDDGKVYEWQWTKPDGVLSLRLIICRCFFCLYFSVARFFPSLQCNFNCIEAAKLKYQVDYLNTNLLKWPNTTLWLMSYPIISVHRQAKVLHSTRITYPVPTFFIPILSQNNNVKPIQSYISRRLSEVFFTSLKHLYPLNFSSRLVSVKKFAQTHAILSLWEYEIFLLFQSVHRFIRIALFKNLRKVLLDQL